MMTVSIMPATPADLEELAALLVEVQDHYAESEPIETITHNTEQALFGDTPRAHALLARVGSHLAGLAAYSFLWPAAGSTSSIYLKELYVRPAQRRLGIGRQLMDELTKIASSQQCSRIEWTTETDSHTAQQFYANLGHQPHTGKILYRIDLA